MREVEGKEAGEEERVRQGVFRGAVHMFDVCNALTHTPRPHTSQFWQKSSSLF